MRNEQEHLSDESLLLAADGEIRTSRAIRRVREHLKACWDCRARMAELEATIAEFVRASRQSGPQLPPIAPARALLRARIADLARERQSAGESFTSFGANVRSLTFVLALVLLVISGGRLLLKHMLRPELFGPTRVYAAPLPNRSFTPGSVRAVSFAELCTSKHEEVIRRVTPAVRHAVFQEYGMEATTADDYEIDHLITPGLGGSDEITNLWPEPHYNTEWNSFVKDQLEERLHQMVCNGQISLSAAQQEIANNWIDAYKKYFDTDRPLSNAATARRPIHTY